MGKRKSSKKPMAKKKGEKLATVFDCLFCNHEKSVGVSMEKKLGVANLSCKVCGQTFQTNINYLSAPVDVYADWHDACDAVAKQTSGHAKSSRGSGPAAKPAAIREEGDDFVVDDELDAEGEYADE